MPAIAAPADKRFRRAHVKPTGRRGSVRAAAAWMAVRIVVVAGLAGYAAWTGVSLVAGATALQVDRITVRGHERLSAGEVLALVDGLRGRNILALRLDAWRERLLSSPWVEEASLRRVLPSTIEVTVRERQPMGIARIGSALYLVDRAGVVVDEYGPVYADISLPIIDGLATRITPGGDATVDEVRAALAHRVLVELGARPDLEKLVSQIDVSDAHDAVVMLDGDTALLRVGDADFVARLQQYLDLRAALRERVPDIDYVDLRFDNRLYVRPARSATAASAQARR
jgi:cell division protein FtsQ